MSKPRHFGDEGLRDATLLVGIIIGVVIAITPMLLWVALRSL